MRRILSFSSSTVQKIDTQLLGEGGSIPGNPDQPNLCVFEAILTATPGATASCTARPLAAMTDGHPGFPIGGEVSLTGTADSNGFVAMDGFPFTSPFHRYGMEVVDITGTGAKVSAKIGA